LSLGIVGVGLYIAIIAIGFYRSVRASYCLRSVVGPFSAGVLVCSVVNSMLSSIQFEPYVGSFLFLVVLAQIAYMEESGGLHFGRPRAAKETLGAGKGIQRRSPIEDVRNSTVFPVVPSG
jgi:hypothetical protein